jgi:methionyl-tRNA formyltransferase
MRVAFLGTPDAAVPTLDLLASSCDVRVVITQPDRARGRSKTLRPSPVKDHAESMGLSVHQPTTSAELLDSLRSVNGLDVAVVVAYGRIIRPDALDLPEKGMLNVHFSLLPRWRGAAPVNRALMAGDTMTGVSIIKLDEGLDTGPVLTAQAIDIDPEDNAGALTDRLAQVGASLLGSCLPDFLEGRLIPQVQSDAGLTYANKIEKNDRLVDTGRSVAQVVNQVRGLAPAPGAIIQIDGEPHKLVAVAPETDPPKPGSWVSRDGRPIFAASDGAVRIDLIQSPGRNVMDSSDWLRGRMKKSGSVS